MSTSNKPRGTESGKPETAMQKLKAVWLRLPEATQDYWREQFLSSRKQSELRAEIARKLSINLPTDSKLTKFRAWLEDQDLRDAQAERMQENERRLKQDHPDWTLDQVREEVLRQSYLETLATGNFKLGLAARKSDIAERALLFDQEKFRFDAVAACRKQLPALKAIESNKSLSESEKTQMFMEKLFGTKPQ